ncbi:MAG: AAA family ATPase [Caulobacter sp.]|nr:AAA family ATPase [Caulobacter sp.]
MRIDEIEVKNFRGIRELSLRDLQSTIVIAGANGSGKSCIFDAIRLLKSAYGGYQQNEWHHWMAEFQINFANNAEAFRTFFQDQSKPLSIKCIFRLHPKEREYLEQNGEELVRNSIWRLIAPEMYGWSSDRAAPMAAQYRDREPEVAALTRTQLAAMLSELSQDTVTGHLWGNSGSAIHFSPSKALEIIFSSFFPGRLGLIDYHGAQRMYTREQVSNVNLDLTAQTQQNKNHALYNYSNKYGSVKTEMASSFIKELLAKEAGVDFDSQNTITKTLKELFSTFFPDKEFLGLKPTIDGGLSFPVRTSSGAIHDLNELSAGEKEVLYGYLRIRNSAPCYSIILIDEPELHLNPRLVRGLPQFYHQHLGVALDNQIWLVTHSDTLLREVVGRPEYSVYHMVGASLDKSTPQIVPITMGEAAQRALISLVGDIAAYRPGKKVVIFEGGGDSEFDVQFTTRLFPELSEQVNVISGGNKLRVRELHDVLDAAQKLGSIPFRTYSITDQDSEKNEYVTSPRFKWDVYHVENYLLEAEFIKIVLLELGDISTTMTTEKIYDKLRKAASSTLKGLIRHELTEYVNNEIISSLNLSFDPKRNDVAKAIGEAMARSFSQLEAASNDKLTDAILVGRESSLRSKLEADLATDAWRRTFRGRDVLKAFAKTNCKASYEVLRNLTIARMSDAGFKPAGMKIVVDQIITS